MAKHSIYLDPYHETLAKYLPKNKNLSALISDAIDSYMRENWDKLDTESWNRLVESIGKHTLDINVNAVPLWQLRESVIKWLRNNQKLPKAKLSL